MSMKWKKKALKRDNPFLNSEYAYSRVADLLLRDETPVSDSSAHDGGVDALSSTATSQHASDDSSGGPDNKRARPSSPAQDNDSSAHDRGAAVASSLTATSQDATEDDLSGGADNKRARSSSPADAAQPQAQSHAAPVFGTREDGTFVYESYGDYILEAQEALVDLGYEWDATGEALNEGDCTFESALAILKAKYGCPVISGSPPSPVD